MSPASTPRHSLQPVEQIPRSLAPFAAERLVDAPPGALRDAGRQFVKVARRSGLDLSRLWGTLDRTSPSSPTVRQVCLAVPAPGRSAMLFVSRPAVPAESEEDRQERASTIVRACEALAAEPGGPRVAQALPAPDEHWAIEAFEGAGFVRVATLAYLRREPDASRPADPGPAWPPGVSVRPVRDVAPASPVRGFLIRALERSYVGTLDCPRLTGMRRSEDVLESHLATGEFNPDLWWLVFSNDQPAGCLLMSRCPDQQVVELVYVGLGPALRGRGVGRGLLALACRSLKADAITCAVDEDNAPALRLYAAFGFEHIARRMALVRRLGAE
jgi:ribosomal protein S18 acetylase RimI-like enzyme